MSEDLQGGDPVGTGAEAWEGGRLAAAFVSHGAPMTALSEEDFAKALGGLGASAQKPRAIVVIADSWQTPRTVRVTASKLNRSVKNYVSGPGDSVVNYTPPGDPVLAMRIVELLELGGASAFPDQIRALDAAAWIPLMLAYPEADVPVVQLSVPSESTPQDLLAIGKLLAPLRDEGVLLLGGCGADSGLDPRSLDRKHAPVKGWARSFDHWVKEHVEAGDLQSLTEIASAPGAESAIPASLPVSSLLVVMGSMSEGEHATTLYEGLVHSSLSMRSFTVGHA